MNGFKNYQNYKGEEIHYKILYKQGSEDLILEFVLSYLDKDIWGDNIYGDFSNGRRYYKKIYLHRDDWGKIKNYPDISRAIEDFNNAISEFENNDNWQEYKNEANVYLIGKVNEIIKNIK